MVSALILTSLIRRFQTVCFYLLIILLPTQLGRHFWPQEVLISGIRVDYLSPTLYLTDIVAILLIILAFSLQLLNGSVAKLLQNGWVKFGLLLILWGGFQSLWVAPVISQLAIKLRMGVGCLVVAAIGNLSYSRKILATIFALQLVGLSFLTTAQALRSGSVNGVMYWLGERRITINTPGVALENTFGALRFRPYATFSHPNVLAGFVVGVLLWLLCSQQLNPLHKKGVIFLFAGWILYLAYSQAAWLAIALLGIGYCLRFLKVFHKPSLVTVSLILAFLMPILLLLVPHSLQSEEIGLRNYLFSQVLKFSLWDWLGGVGWSGFFGKLSVYNVPALGRVWLQPIHNSLWVGVSSVGVVFGILLSLWLWFNKGFKHLKPQMIPVISIVLVLVSLDHYWLTQPQTFYLLVLVLAESLHHPQRSL